MMNRRIAKTLALSALLVLALPVVASAQMSRVEGMAIQGDFIKDWSNVFTYTSQVPNVGNLVYGELGNVASPPVTSDRGVGAVLGNLWEGRLGTWSIHLREQTPNLGQGDASEGPGTGLLGSDPNTNTFESFDLMWGKKFGTTSLGFRVNRSFGSWVAEGGGVTSKLESDLQFFDANLARNVFGLGAGLGFEMNPTSSVEMNVMWQRRTWLDETTVPAPGVNSKNENDGANAYLIAGRAMWQWQPNVLVVPVVKYYNFDLSEKYTLGTTTDPYDNARKGWQIGVAGNWTLGSNDLFVLGMNVAQNNLKQQRDLFGIGNNLINQGILPPGEAFNDTLELTESFTPQLFASLETHVNSWLTVRFGASKGAWEKIKFEGTGGSTVELKLSSFDMRLGAGLKFGNLQLDAILANNFPNNLPYFISGNTTSNMFTKVTATYPF